MEKMKGRLTPERVQKILASHGTETTYEQAVAILDFLRKLAKATVSLYFKADTVTDKNEKSWLISKEDNL